MKKSCVSCLLGIVFPIKNETLAAYFLLGTYDTELFRCIADNIISDSTVCDFMRVPSFSFFMNHRIYCY